jgi:hypothetical protein
MPNEHESRQNKTEETNMALTIEQIQSLDRASLDRMTSDAYKENFDVNTNPNAAQFRAKIEAIENGPRTATRARGNVRGEEASAPAPTSGFDPSFDDNPNTPAESAAVSAQPVPVPVVVPGELAVWTYQPTDREGRPLGGVQRFKYDPSLPVDDPKSLASQLTKSNVHAVRMAKERRVEAVIDEVKKVDTGYKPPVFLTREQHPEFEALNAVTRDTINNGTQSAMNAFRQGHPEFVASESNAVALVKWVEKSGRNPVDAQTWEAAWQALKPYLAVEAPTPAATESVAEVPAPAPAPAPVAAAPVRVAAGVPSGLSDADAFNGPDPFEVQPKVIGVKLLIDNKVQTVTLQSWERLSSDAQKRILRNSANAASIESLYTANDAARQAAARR